MGNIQMKLDFYVHVRAYEKRVNGKQPLFKPCFIRRISFASNAIQTIVNELINLTIYCLNCIRHMKSSTFEMGLKSEVFRPSVLASLYFGTF